MVGVWWLGFGGWGLVVGVWGLGFGGWGSGGVEQVLDMDSVHLESAEGLGFRVES